MVESDYRVGVVDELKRLDVLVRQTQTTLEQISAGMGTVHKDISNHMVSMTKRDDAQRSTITKLTWGAVGLGFSLVGSLIFLLIQNLS